MLTCRYTCGRKFGSLDNEEVDAQTYAEWEIDYLSTFSHPFVASSHSVHRIRQLLQPRQERDASSLI
jgi:hypothetical protein